MLDRSSSNFLEFLQLLSRRLDATSAWLLLSFPLFALLRFRMLNRMACVRLAWVGLCHNFFPQNLVHREKVGDTFR